MALLLLQIRHLNYYLLSNSSFLITLHRLQIEDKDLIKSSISFEAVFPLQITSIKDAHKKKGIMYNTFEGHFLSQDKVCDQWKLFFFTFMYRITVCLYPSAPRIKCLKTMKDTIEFAINFKCCWIIVFSF